VRSRFFDSALILGYHRIAEVSWDPYSMCVKPKHFAEHLEVFRKYTKPISLEKLAQAVESENVPMGALVVTFDDGYSDNLYEASPLLERYEIPATFFITTGNIGKQFWWDKLENILFTPKRLPEKLDLKINGKNYKWIFDGTTKKSRDDRKPESRLKLLLTLYKIFLPLSINEREKMMEQISSWAGTPQNADLSSRALSPDEIIKLSKGNLIDIGAHTISHPILAKLTINDQQQEIQQSKASLENISNSKVNCFSYPNGSLSKETIRLVRKAGFICACASHNDIITKGSDRFRLPRFWVRDWDRTKLEQWLIRWVAN
jgi:peptidoglycan/xylan/chitin deacetylase (PgdA/CDA1 family)